ncbi:MAG: NAD(P)H-dependent oxidoreductase subunit E [Thermoflexales bacterium]|nr:NAD(P)H-dependent oxidoreductase subunit E [Thermoflexales bacterium]
MSHLEPRRSELLPALQDLQQAEGYVSEAGATRIATALHVPVSDVHGLVTFYDFLRTEPPPDLIHHICVDAACTIAGADALRERLRAEGAIVHDMPCPGRCNRAPNGMLERRGVMIGPLDEDQPNVYDHVDGDMDWLTALCRRPRPATLADYIASGGMRGFERALREPPARVIAELDKGGLAGRGGAGFAAATKWQAVASAPGKTKYVIVNADESEPGTFKDRILLERDPWRPLEGALLAAYAVGAQRIYIYIRGEYPRAIAAVRAAVTTLERAGYLGDDVLGSGLRFEIEVRAGSGAYICGEETALIESIEGKRGLPRLKPPYPVTAGLFGAPTVVNNVETLAAAQVIVERGAEAYGAYGTPRSPGPKLFCVSGDVARPGLYEMPFGVTLRALIERAGGVKGELQALLIGGAAGALAGPEVLDTRLSFEDMRAAGLPLGSGVVMAFNTTRDLRSVVRGIARFFAHESCGKCYPCQLGTQRQREVIERLMTGKALPGDRERLTDIGWTMTDASLCGLGQTAASAILSALKRWPEIFAS